MKFENETTQLAEFDLYSTTQMSREIGLPINLPASWIVQQLGIKPQHVLRGGAAIYWHREQFKQIRRGLIQYLIKQEFSEQ